MKLNFILLLFVGVLVGSCSTPEPPKPLVERNEEVRDYFKVLNELIDEYGDLIENMITSAQEIEEKEDPSFLDGLNMFGDMATSIYKIKKLSDEIEGMEDQHKKFEQDLSADDFMEFMELYKNTIVRFTNLVEKYESHENSEQ